MRPSGRSRGSVPGRKNVTTLSLIAARRLMIQRTRAAPLSTCLAGNNASILGGRQLSNGSLSALAFARRRVPRHAPAFGALCGEREMGRKRSAGGAPGIGRGKRASGSPGSPGGRGGGRRGWRSARPAFGAAELSVEPWMTEPGAPFIGYGQPSRFEAKVVRTFASAPGTTGTGASRTPLQRLNGTITPNGLHFERHHSGIPDIDPDAHRLLIHGLVKRPLIFTLGGARSISDGDPHRLHRMRRQYRRALSEGARPARPASKPRPIVLCRVDRGQARAPARRSWVSSRKRNGSSPRVPTPPA